MLVPNVGVLLSQERNQPLVFVLWAWDSTVLPLNVDVSLTKRHNKLTFERLLFGILVVPLTSKTTHGVVHIV